MDTQLNAFHDRTCFICNRSIDEVKKASGLGVGAGLGIIAHDNCLQALSDAKQAEDDKEARVVGDYMQKAQGLFAQGLIEWLVNDVGMTEVK